MTFVQLTSLPKATTTPSTRTIATACILGVFISPPPNEAHLLLWCKKLRNEQGTNIFEESTKNNKNQKSPTHDVSMQTSHRQQATHISRRQATHIIHRKCLPPPPPHFLSFLASCDATAVCFIHPLCRLEKRVFVCGVRARTAPPEGVVGGPRKGGRPDVAPAGPNGGTRNSCRCPCQ